METEAATQIELKLSLLIEELRTTNGDTSDIQSLNKQIRHLMNQLRTKIKNIEVGLRETRSEEEREQLKLLIEWHNTQSLDLQKNLQRANLYVKSRQDQRDRDELLGSVRDEESTVRQRKRQESSLQAASNVTDSLRELRETLATSLKGSEDTIRTLVDSSGLLRDTDTEMKDMSSHINISTRLITKYGRREVVDKILIFFGLVLFFSVVIYILKKRLIG